MNDVLVTRVRPSYGWPMHLVSPGYVNYHRRSAAWFGLDSIPTERTIVDKVTVEAADI